MEPTLWSKYTVEERSALAAHQLTVCLNDATDAVSRAIAERVSARAALRDVRNAWRERAGGESDRFKTKDEYLSAVEDAKALLEMLGWIVADCKYQVNTIRDNRDRA